MKQYRRLLGYLRPYLWPHGALAILAMLGFSAVESSIPFLAKFTFDQVFTQQHRDALPLAVVGLLAVVLFPVAGLPLRYFSKQLRQTGRRMQEGIGRLNAMLHENVQGNRVVKAFGQEGYEQERFHEHNERLFRVYMRQSLLRAVPITELLAGIAVAGIIYYGGGRVIARTRAQGAFVGLVVPPLLPFRPVQR